jgi:hypothetical protein
LQARVNSSVATQSRKNACFIQEAEAARYFETQGKEGDKKQTKRRQKKRRNVIDGVIDEPASSRVTSSTYVR